MKVLVLTPEPVDTPAIRAVLGDGVDLAGAEVLVVSPATNSSRLAFWVSDADDAVAEALQAATDTVERLEEDGVDAVGETGESEPQVALRDALATFKADHVVVFLHVDGERDYREAVDEAQVAVPVHFGEISR